MGTFGITLMVCGALIALASHIMILVAAHEYGPGWVLWCFFVPVVLWLLIVTDFRRFWKPTVVQLAGGLLIFLGASLAGPV